MCKLCGEGTVLTVDLLGRLVTIANDTLFLSPCCGTFLYYGGTGHEFAPACGAQCAAPHHLYRKRERQPLPTARPTAATTAAATTTTTMLAAQQQQRACLICHHKHGAQQVIRLLDLRTRAVVVHVLCPKHVVPQHILQHVLETNDLLRYFQQRQRTNAALASTGTPPITTTTTRTTPTSRARPRKRPRLTKRPS